VGALSELNVDARVRGFPEGVLSLEFLLAESCLPEDRVKLKGKPHEVRRSVLALGVGMDWMD
jgi:hypothetical protein